jgi:hypothetical protein
MTVEGSVGTWSHCGNREPHDPHTHDIAFPEGNYPNVQCLGTKMCTGYVQPEGFHVTCRCRLFEHADDVPHECQDLINCGGSWFGTDGRVEQVVKLPLAWLFSK